MLKSFFFAVVAVSLMADGSRAADGGTEASPSNCLPRQYEGESIAITIAISGTGRQCLIKDLSQRSVRDLDNGRSIGEPGQVINFFRANDVELDLQGHLVTAEPFDDQTGIALNQEASPHNHFAKQIAVRNGIVRTPGARGVGIYLGFFKDYALEVGLYSRAYETVDEDATTMSRESQIQAKDNSKIVFVDPWDYKPPTHFTLSNLTIQAGGRGVIMTGAQNVLKDSTIEVDGDTAVYLYGPGAVVEGNTFILHLDAKYPYPAKLPAALKLRDADGAVIRNNRFIVKGRWPWSKPQATAAINLIASRDVVIENNVVENTRELLRKDGASTVVERDNQVK